jgi:hypothetical protein
MKNKLSFCSINILSDVIAEIIVNENIEISLEMVEELEDFLSAKFTQSFGLLINKVHYYSFAFEAKLSIASNANLKAMAVIDYTEEGKSMTADVVKIRKIDGWNLSTFAGENLGWQQGFEWLKKELLVAD